MTDLLASLFPSTWALPIWVELMLIGVLLCFILILCWVWIANILHQKRELQRLLVEKSELLRYATSREQKALEKAAEVDNSKKKLLSSTGFYF